MDPDERWLLQTLHPSIHTYVLKLCKESVPHMLFEIPPPWRAIRSHLEDFYQNQSRMREELRQIDLEAIASGKVPQRGGLLQLCLEGPGDCKNIVKYEVENSVKNI